MSSPPTPTVAAATGPGAPVPRGRPTVEFARYLLGRRGPFTELTAAESALLLHHARDAARVVEVGVFEGATSRALARVMPAGGELVLVDPFPRGTRPERLLGISYCEHIARRAVRGVAVRVAFVRLPSVAAARQVAGPFDLVFLDADHSYAAAREDFEAWAPHLAPRGHIALHDSAEHPTRPLIHRQRDAARYVEELVAGGAWRRAAVAESLTVLARA